MAWKITKDGLNNMLENYIGIEVTLVGFLNLYQALQDLNEGDEYDYDEDDNSISDTFPRGIILDTIVNKFVEGHEYWPCNIDSEETQANFKIALKAALDDGLNIKRLSKED